MTVLESESLIFVGEPGTALCEAPEAIAAIARGEMVVVVDDENRENGGDLTVSVDGTPTHGVTTGISAFDRATTIALALSGTTDDLQRPGHVFLLVARRGGLLVRNGRTEASVDLARLAGCRPAGVIVEIIGEHGHLQRLDSLVDFARTHGLRISSIEKLQAHLFAQKRAS